MIPLEEMQVKDIIRVWKVIYSHCRCEVAAFDSTCFALNIDKDKAWQKVVARKDARESFWDKIRKVEWE